MMENQSRANVCKLKEWPNAESRGAVEKYNRQLMKTGGYTPTESQRIRSSQITESGTPKWPLAVQIRCNSHHAHSLNQDDLSFLCVVAYRTIEV